MFGLPQINEEFVVEREGVTLPGEKLSQILPLRATLYRRRGRDGASRKFVRITTLKASGPKSKIRGKENFFLSAMIVCFLNRRRKIRSWRGPS